jgi:integrase
MVLAMRATGLSPASCNRHLSALSAVLEQADHAPAIPWQKEPKGRQRWYTQDEVRLLAQACLTSKHGQAVSSLVLFLAETGLRVGEALALEWVDLELEGNRPHAKVADSKNGDSRWVPLTTDAAQAARTRTGPRGPWCGLSQSTVNHVFRSAREAVSSTRGDAECVVHTLRHTAASRLVRAGVSLPVVSAWLGHRDFRSTLRYTHVDEQGLTNAARLLQDAQ